MSANDFPTPSNEEEARLKEILGKPCTVAVVGMSPKQDRPSYEVGMYLHNKGFDVIPVHPAAEEIGGLKVYSDLEAIPGDKPIEIVDLFVAGARVMPVVEKAAKIKAKRIWFQPGTENPEAEARAKELGLDVISGRCTKADHQLFFPG